LRGKTRLQNDLLYVGCYVKLYTLTHLSFYIRAGFEFMILHKAGSNPIFLIVYSALDVHMIV